MSDTEIEPPAKPDSAPAESESFDGVISFKVGDKIHTLDWAQLGARDARAIRRETGMSLQEVAAAFSSSPDIDLVAVMVWRARVQEGETDLTLDDVEDGITYSTDIDVLEVDPVGETHAGS